MNKVIYALLSLTLSIGLTPSITAGEAGSIEASLQKDLVTASYDVGLKTENTMVVDARTKEVVFNGNRQKSNGHLKISSAEDLRDMNSYNRLMKSIHSVTASKGACERVSDIGFGGAPYYTYLTLWSCGGGCMVLEMGDAYSSDMFWGDGCL